MEVHPSFSEDYFKTSQQNISISSSTKITKTFNDIHQLLYKYILEGTLLISDVPEHIHLNKDRTDVNDKSKLAEIRQQKLNIMRKLDRIHEEELRIRDVKGLNTFKERSDMTEEDKALLKNLMKANRDFEKTLRKKDIEIRKRLISMKQKDEENMKLEKDQRNQQRNQEAKMKIQQIKARSLDRKNRKEQQDQLIADIKKKRHLFLRMQDRFQQEQSSLKQNTQKLQQQIKKSKLIKYQNIKEHQKKYEQTLQKQREERANKLNQIVSNQKKIREWLPQESGIYKNLKYHNENQQKEDAFKSALPKIYTDKRKEYGNMIKQNVFPNMKLKPLQIKQSASPLRSLSSNELYEKGKQYMQDAVQYLNQVKSKMTKQKKRQSNKQTPAIECKTTDYLKEQRGKNKKKINHLKQLASMIDRQELSPEKVEKTKHYLQILQPKIENDPRKLIQLMNLKIEMLQQIN